MNLFSNMPPSSILPCARRGELMSLSILPYTLKSDSTAESLMDTLDIQLLFLDRKLVPSNASMLAGEPKAIRDGERGLESLTGIEIFIEHLNQHKGSLSPNDLRRILIKLERRVEDLALWFLFSVRQSTWNFPGKYKIDRMNARHALLVVNMTSGMLTLPAEVAKAVRESDSIADALVRTWLLRNRIDFEELIHRIGPGRRIGPLFYPFVFHKDL